MYIYIYIYIYIQQKLAQLAGAVEYPTKKCPGYIRPSDSKALTLEILEMWNIRFIVFTLWSTLNQRGGT